jgi:hypothetical protein
LGPAAGIVPNIAALSTFQYGESTANDQIRARFARELTGFYIVFFSFVAFALLHAAFSLWRPVKDYMRQRRVLQNHDRNETLRCGSQDAIVPQNGTQVLRAMGPDSDKEWQMEDIQMYQRERGMRLSFAKGRPENTAPGIKHPSQPEILDRDAGGTHWS